MGLKAFVGKLELGAVGGVVLTDAEQGDILYFSGTSWINLHHGAAGEVLTSGGDGANPSWAAAGGSGTGIIWEEVTGTSKAAEVDYGYICNNAGLVTVTLPDTATVGAVVAVAGKGAGLWKLKANAGETIKFGNKTTSDAGYLQGTLQYDTVSVVCITADTTWEVYYSVGNLTIA